MADEVLLSFDANSRAATICLNRPKKGNSFSPALQNRVIEILERLQADDAVQSIILTGNGRFFCTGMDLSSSGGSTSGGAERAYDEGKRIFEAIDNCRKPTIALINGSCYGGGNGLAFACDVRLAVDSATFVLSEVKRGLVPALISRYIIREWGSGKAREAMLSGRPVTTSELQLLGAIHSTHSTLEVATKAAHAFATLLLTSAPGAMATCKALLRTAYREGGVGMDREIKSAFVTMMAPSDEAQYGIGQFQKKEPVDWMEFKRRRSSKL